MQGTRCSSVMMMMMLQLESKELQRRFVSNTKRKRSLEVGSDRAAMEVNRKSEDNRRQSEMQAPHVPIMV